MGKRVVKHVTIIGSGVMGSRIACHFANVGIEVLLLDIVPKEINDKEKAMGLSEKSPAFRNRIVNDSLQSTLKSKPSPIYSAKFVSRISTGNIDDNLPEIANSDWVIEAIIERADIKKSLYEKVEKYRKAGSLISTNTSGIPLKILSEGRSTDFKENFIGTHFFNPPRYLPLLEIIPSPEGKQELVDFLTDFGSKILGKKVILCNDTPAFIANRVGVFSIMSAFRHTKELGLSFETVDTLTGPLLGRQKSATFRTCDVVGLDTLVHVADGLFGACKHDERVDVFETPSYIRDMIEKNLLGSKTRAGFFKKVKGEKGSEILSLNPDTFDYVPLNKERFDSVGQARGESQKAGIKTMFNADDKGGQFIRATFLDLFAYVANRMPEIADNVKSIDDAVKAGFGWKYGPFEYWDIMDAKSTLPLLQKAGLTIPESVQSWIKENGSFYKIEGGKKLHYTHGKSWVSGSDKGLNFEILQKTNVVWQNKSVTASDIGDGILNIGFHSKMNAVGGDILGGIIKSIEIAEEQFKGVTMYNEGDNFSAGANVGMIFMLAAEQEYDELDLAVKTFQNTVMRIRHSSIPVVIAPHNLALGGACEMCMHADKVVAHAETYMGLVEFGVGIIPAGAGTKEFALRLSDELSEGDIRLNKFRERFLTIGQAKVSTSAKEAFELGYLREGIDMFVTSREHQLATAKREALALAERGYVQPIKRKDITVLGAEGLGIVYSGASSMHSANYISEHDALISRKFGEVLAGGDFNRPTQVSEDYLLKLERKAFVELCTTRKTMERLQSLIKSGKILRN
ncbi:MAG: 3-hydroxyacyl-CoA dehydrogenase [Luteibaculaceae bacterium]|jgi:3-hydroxyacyl-CoA dehydrogenase